MTADRIALCGSCWRWRHADHVRTNDHGEQICVRCSDGSKIPTYDPPEGR